MKSNNPLVSILTPSYQQGEWILDCINSVGSQSYPHLEHIVMDGQSNDNTVKTLMSKDGSSLVWKSEADKGQADALNKAYRLSKGEILGWLNSDDCYISSSTVADVVQVFEKNPQVDVVYGHSLQIARDGHFIQVLWTPEFDSQKLLRYDFISQPAAFFRKSALGDFFLDSSLHFAMDYDLWLRLSEKGSSFKRVDAITGIERVQPDRKSANLHETLRRETAILQKKYGLQLGHLQDKERRRFYIKQRLLGALLIPSIPKNVAFSVPQKPHKGLLSRQLFLPKRYWVKEYL